MVPEMGAVTIKPNPRSIGQAADGSLGAFEEHEVKH